MKNFYWDFVVHLFDFVRKQKGENGSLCYHYGMVDSAGHKADTLLEAEVKEEPKPMEADELFDDFIFNYASDDALQRQRTVFPLPYYNRDTPSKIEEEFWKHDYLFTKQNYYTLLLIRKRIWTWWAILR